MTDLSTRLAKLPLFSGFDEADLEALLLVFEERTLAPGETLFRAGDAATHLHLLVDGAISARGDEGEVLVASAPCPLGELGVLTGETRALTAVASGTAKVLEAKVERLEEVLSTNARVGFLLQRNLLRLALRKIGRDRRRLSEMRDNIKSTQRAMKAMRDALLDSEDSPLHAALFEQLDALVEQNRRIHYLVEPSRLVPTHVRLTDGKLRRVTALSCEWLYFDGTDAGLAVGQELTAVLVIDGVEMPVIGHVESTSPDCAVFLDELIPEYDEALTRHLTRAQMLDVVF